MAEDLKLLGVVVPRQGLLRALHVEDVEEQLLLVACGVSLIRDAVEREVGTRVSDHVLSEYLEPNLLILVEDVFQVLLDRVRPTQDNLVRFLSVVARVLAAARNHGHFEQGALGALGFQASLAVLFLLLHEALGCLDHLSLAACTTLKLFVAPGLAGEGHHVAVGRLEERVL